MEEKAAQQKEKDGPSQTHLLNTVEVAGTKVSVEFKEAAGDNPSRLHLRLPAERAGNKQIPPKTIFFAARGDEYGKVIKSESTTLRWAFEKTKNVIISELKNKEVGPLKELSAMVAGSGASHIAKHSPSFSPGKLPNAMTIDLNLAFVPTDALSKLVLKHVAECDAMSVCFIVKCNKEKAVTPVGWALYTTLSK